MFRADTPDVLMTWLYHADFLGTLAAALGPRTKLVWNIRCADMDLSKYGYVSRGLPHVLARLSRLPAVVVANSEAGRHIHETLWLWATALGDPSEWLRHADLSS